MKSKIQLKYTVLKLIVDLYDTVMEHKRNHRIAGDDTLEIRAIKNLLNLLIIRFKKKLLTIDPTSKPFKISIHYYESYYLFQFINDHNDFIPGPYEQAIIYQITQQIYRQL